MYLLIRDDGDYPAIIAVLFSKAEALKEQELRGGAAAGYFIRIP
jgi:hypothetical protein